MRRRDFTVNAIAKRLATGELVDPLGGAADLERARPAHGVADELRGGSAPPRARPALRLAARLRAGRATLAQMRERGGGVRLVSGERIGGGLAADGMGELSKLLLGARPGEGAAARARHRRARRAAAGVRAARSASTRRAASTTLTLDEHIFAVVQAAADAGAPLARAARRALPRPRQAARRLARHRRAAALLRKAGLRRQSHEQVGAELATSALARLRYPTALRAASSRSSAGTCSTSEGRRRCARAASSRSTGTSSRSTSSTTRTPTSAASPGRTAAAARGPRAARAVPQRCSSASAASPHRLADLAVDGSDLIELGFTPGPELGRVLETLLARGRRGSGARTRATRLLAALRKC